MSNKKNKSQKEVIDFENSDPNSLYTSGFHLLKNTTQTIDGLKYIFKSNEYGNSKADKFIQLNIQSIYKNIVSSKINIDISLKFNIGRYLCSIGDSQGIGFLKEALKAGYTQAECFVLLHENSILISKLEEKILTIFSSNDEYSKEMITQEFKHNKYYQNTLSSIHSSIQNSISYSSYYKYLLALFIISTSEYDINEGIRLLQEAAEEHDAKSQYLISLLYLEGKYGYIKNNKESFYFLEKSANQGFGLAEYQLSKYYITPIGVRKNEKEGFKWINKSIESGVEKAYFQIGSYYLNGIGVIKDAKKAYSYLKKAVKEYEDCNACYCLAGMYLSGEDVQKNETKAFKLLSKARYLGHESSCYLLGELYSKGVGCIKNEKEAFNCYKEASKKDHTKALLRLGVCYIFGNGVKEDVSKGISIIGFISDKLDLEEIQDIIKLYRAYLKNKKVKKLNNYFSYFI